MKLTAVIIEDEFKVREVFTKLLTEFCKNIEIVGEANNINDGYELILLTKPSVVFLDIEMPGGNGFELLSKFPKIPFEVVFVTSHDHYAIRAIKYSALDYLLKPVMIADFMQIEERLREKIEISNKADMYQVLLRNLKQEESKTLVVNTKTKAECIPMTEIMYLSADGNYTFIQAKTNKVHVAKTLKDYDELLCKRDMPFMRIHKACIINTNYIKEVHKGDSSTVVLTNGVSLQISRRKKQELMERLNLDKS